MEKLNNYGKCHLCGKVGKLTYEHVPPRAAFNSHKAFIYFVDDILGSNNLPWDYSGIRGRQQQRGVGYYTLCAKCNNNTGSWYGSSFVDFIYKGYRETYNKIVAPNEWIKVTFQDIYPLRIIKEIITMFFSINNPDLSTILIDLRNLVLKREKRGIDPKKYGLYIYVLRGSIARYAGITSMLSLEPKHIRVLSELSAPPFGYVLELEPKDKSAYCDITFFANSYKITKKETLNLKIPVYESNTPFPTDYRSKQKVMADYIKGKLIKQQRRSK
jgi:hypothetical protein